ncbi:acyl-CoA thioesterase [Candidatus Liberibacter sp.]|uniref:acyl-CoA thioesterase n=1 Tax=Candidatus Liberibacter sp. TaxID=34022 RepID=UPI0015F3C0F1|nr:acyl-CoA thioesterase [Candidatus Liberibacter sp.]MBA5723749.1 acyl-CoA thioesterase [Candidatus Liberibacter sp.]
MNNIHPSPDKLMLKVQTMPTDVNLDGNIFGGWLMSQMDIACGIHASQIAKGSVATRAVKELLFEKPVKVGDVVHIYTETRKIGRTSITVYCSIWTSYRYLQEDFNKVSEAIFVMVALDKNGNSRSVITEKQ